MNTCGTRGCNAELRASLLLDDEGWWYCDVCRSYTKRHIKEEKQPEPEEEPEPEEICAEHPTYGAMRKPRRKCATCWTAYRERWPERVQTEGPFCDEHPRYQALRKPRRDCHNCWEAYGERWPERV